MKCCVSKVLKSLDPFYFLLFNLYHIVIKKKEANKPSRNKQKQNISNQVVCCVKMRQKLMFGVNDDVVRVCVDVSCSCDLCV